MAPICRSSSIRAAACPHSAPCPLEDLKPRKVRQYLLVHFVRPQGDPTFAQQTRRLLSGFIPAVPMKVVELQAIKIEPVRVGALTEWAKAFRRGPGGESHCRAIFHPVTRYATQDTFDTCLVACHTGSNLVAGLPRMVISSAIRKGAVLEGEQRPLQKFQDWAD